jgi:hypothetical protein
MSLSSVRSETTLQGGWAPPNSLNEAEESRPKTLTWATFGPKFALRQTAPLKSAHADCGQPLVEGGTIVGEVCHIKGEKPGAARYDPDQTDAERHAFENLICMCRKHHKIIDTEKENYSVERLLEMKRTHETSDSRRYVITDELVQRLGEMLAAEAEALAIWPVSGGSQDDRTEIMCSMPRGACTAKRGMTLPRRTPRRSATLPRRILTWYCIWLAQHMQIYGARRPSAKIEPLTLDNPTGLRHH